MSKILVQISSDASHMLSDVVDTDIREFEQWFKSIGNDPLMGLEAAIIKTYISWKLGVHAGGVIKTPIQPVSYCEEENG